MTLHRLASILYTAALCGAAASQQIIEIHPGSTPNSSRGSLGSAAGELHQGFHSSLFRGIGDHGAGCAIRGVQAVIQDQNDATADTWRLVLRSGTDTSGPNATTGGVLATLGPFAFPAGPGVARSYIFTSQFGTPMPVPCSSFFAVGAELSANASWPADGLSVQYSASSVNAQHAAAPDVAWQVIGGVVSHPASKRSWRLGVLVDGGAFQPANTTTTAPTVRFGIGGFHPDTALTGTGSASQGLAFRCSHPLGAGGLAIVLMSVDFGAAPITVSTVANRTWLDLATIAPFPILTGPADGSTLPFFTAGTNAVPAAGGLRLAFQCAVLDPIGNTLEFSNAIALTLH